MRISPGFSLLLVSAALSALAAAPAAEQSPAPNYYPLTETLRWEMSIRFRIAGAEQKKASAVSHVDGVAEIAGRRYFKLVTEITGTPADSTQVIYYRSDGRNIYQVFGDHESEGEFLFMPAVPEVGETWKVEAPIGTFTTKVLAKEDVRLGEKVFRDCLKMSVTMKRGFATIEQTQWLAPGIGVIRQTQEGVLYSSDAVLARYRR